MKELRKILNKIEASINGSLDGLELDNTDDVIEKSAVIEQMKELQEMIVEANEQLKKLSTDIVDKSDKDYILVSDELPEKGTDVLGMDENGNKYECFRCACPNPNCIEWRCTTTGQTYFINVVKNN